MFVNNKDLKTKFLSREGRNQRYYDLTLSVLKVIDGYESRNNVDIHKFNKNDILRFFKETNYKTLSSLKSVNTVIKSYIAFCNKDHDLKLIITEKDLNGIIKQGVYENKYITENEYLDILKLRDKDDEINYMDLAMIVLLWRGIKGTEYTDLSLFKKEWFDYNNSEINYDSRKIKLLPIESEIIRKCIDEETYRHYGDTTREEAVVKLSTESDLLLKPTNHFNSRNNLSSHSIKLRLHYFLKNKVGKISSTDIYASGCVYNVLKNNGFSKLRVVDLDAKIKQNYQRVSYNNLKVIQETILDKVSTP